MIELDQNERQKLISIIVSIPEMQSARGRREILELAGLREFIPRIDLTGPTGEVVGSLVSILSNHGRISSGKEALAVFLNTLKDNKYTGIEQQEFIGHLLSKYKKSYTRSQDQPFFNQIIEKESKEKPSIACVTGEQRSDRIQIFLAHASEDKQKVIEIYDRLLLLGYSPWLDKKNLIAGQNWKREIPKAIKNSDIFIACFSSKSINKTGYIQRELKLALDKLAEIPESKIFLIPLRLDNCSIPELQRPDLGINLRDIHWLDFWEQDGFENLIKAIEFSQHRNPEPKLRELDLLLFGTKLQKFDFEVVTVNTSGREVKRDQSFAEYFSEDLSNGVTLDMVAILGGQFLMGMEESEIERLVKKFNWDGYRREKPQHSVTVKPFFMGKFPVTQAQWRAVANLSEIERSLEADPSNFKGDKRPVEGVSWDEAVEFCKRLSRKTGREYRLPSEAEWEYAIRAGTNTSFHFGETITSELANYPGSFTYADEPEGEYRKKTTDVGSFPPNAFGLYDMHGNVWEWCADDWHDDYQNAPTDCTAWLSDKSNIKVIRGGSWAVNPFNCRSASRGSLTRDSRYDNIGFRVMCVAPRTT